MLGFIKKLFGSTPVETKTEVPYKVEVATPVPAVKAEEPKTVANQASEAVVKSVAKPKQAAAKAPAKKAAPPKTAAGKKPSRKPKAK
jgi:hypothetical protein